MRPRGRLGAVAMSARLQRRLGVLFFHCAMWSCFGIVLTTGATALLLLMGAWWTLLPALHVLAVFGVGLVVCGLLALAAAVAGKWRS